MKVSSLLNHDDMEIDSQLQQRSTQTPPNSTYNDASSDYTPASTPHRKTKVKLAKDAAKFEEGRPNGEVRYMPHEISNEKILKRLAKFCIYPPVEQIMRYPRHIPYASGKKEFQLKTGRLGFEVFQYTFKVKSSDKPDKEWVVMWDYNIGLVRITPFFKCMPGNRKTDPKNAILSSPNLMAMCYSITGGALAAQGYWVPFSAARALASTFCYSIRYPLTILFGASFATNCTHPDDPIFKRWSIPASIVSDCQRQVAIWTAKNGVCKTSGTTLRQDSRSGNARVSGKINLKIKLKGELLRPRDVGVYDPSELEESDADTAITAANNGSSAENSEDEDLPNSDRSTPPTIITNDVVLSRTTSFDLPPSTFGWMAANHSLPSTATTIVCGSTEQRLTRRGATLSPFSAHDRRYTQAETVKKKRAHDTSEQEEAAIPGRSEQDERKKQRRIKKSAKELTEDAVFARRIYSPEEVETAGALLSLRYGPWDG